MAYNKCLFFSQNMGNPGIRNATLITERPSCLPTNGNLITLLVFIIGGKKKWCLNSSLSHQPPPPQPKREGLKKTGLVKGMTSAAKELMWHGKRAGRGQTGEMQRRLWKRGVREPETLFHFHQCPWISHLTSCYSCSCLHIGYLRSGYNFPKLAMKTISAR